METEKAQRDAYQEKMHARLDELQAHVDELRAKAEATQADAKVRILEEISHIQEKQQEAAEQVRKLNESGGHAWDDLRKGAESAWNEVSGAVEQARRRFG
jgi:uncharacterized protein YicC (UPF0701 family)